MDPLIARWLGLSIFRPRSTLAESYGLQLLDRYREPHRHHHTLTHLRECLEHLDLFRPHLTNPEDVELALWFHDAVYQPTSKSNEKQSAALASAMLKRFRVPSARTHRIHRMILLTKHEEQAEGYDEQTLLDIDLAILGADPERYAAYETGIREEYRVVPQLLYRPARRKILTAFLSREHIYLTEPARVRWEAHARQNLSMALEAL